MKVKNLNNMKIWCFFKKILFINVDNDCINEWKLVMYIGIVLFKEYSCIFLNIYKILLYFNFFIVFIN